MRKKEFLESGLLQDYVLGLLTAEEQETVEQWIQKDSEIANEYNSLQETLQAYSETAAVKPPSDLKEKIMGDLFNDQVNQIPINKSLKYLTWIFASIATIVILFLSWLTYSTAAELDKVQASLEDCQTEKTQQVNALEQEVSLYSFIADNNTQKTILQGMGSAPRAVSQVFWNSEVNKAYIDLNAIPPCPEGKSYQLWADVDGLMVSMGVLPKNQEDLVEVIYIQGSESFNITIEKEGGSDHPDVSQLILSGRI